MLFTLRGLTVIKQTKHTAKLTRMRYYVFYVSKKAKGISHTGTIKFYYIVLHARGKAVSETTTSATATSRSARLPVLMNSRRARSSRSCSRSRRFGHGLSIHGHGKDRTLGTGFDKRPLPVVFRTVFRIMKETAPNK